MGIPKFSVIDPDPENFYDGCEKDLINRENLVFNLPCSGFVAGSFEIVPMLE